MKRILAGVFCFLFLLTDGQVTNITPEGHISRNYTREDGLPYDHVINMVQDQTGFLWLATWDGLSRYDGYEFKNYFPKPGDSTSIPFFVINHVGADQLNNIWVHCNLRPLVKYDRAKDIFGRFCGPGIRDTVNRGVFFSSDGKSMLLMFPDEQKLVRYQIGSKQFANCKAIDNDSLRLRLFWGNIMIQDNTGDLWSIQKTTTGLNFLTGKWLNDSTISLKNVDPLTTELSSLQNSSGTYDFYNIFHAESGRIWMFSNYGVFVMEPGTDLFSKFSGQFPPGEFKGMKYNAWISGGKVYIIDPERNKTVQIEVPEGSSLFSWYIDNSHNIWYGTVSESRADMGLTRLTETPDYFHHYLTGKDEKGNLNPVFSIVKDCYGNIWAGTRGKGYLFRIKPDGTTQKVSFSHLYPGSEPPRVRSIISDSAGIWVGCTGTDLLQYDIKKGIFRKWSLPLENIEGGVKNFHIHNILKDNKDVIISGDGIYRFTPDTKNFKRYFSYPLISNAFTFSGDAVNGYWAGIHRNSVIRFNPELKVTGYFNAGADQNLIEHICPGDSNDVWVAIMGGGLGHIYPETGKSESFTTANGLSNNTTYSILKDKRGNLWISSNQGISMFNPKTRQFRNFGKNEGLQIVEFDSDACFQAPDGEMFFGGVGGLVSFYPDSIYKTYISPEPAPLVITEFKVSGKVRTFGKAVYDLDSLSLQKGDNNFQITFACIDFAFADKISYRYRLSEADTSWTRTDFRNRRINYTNLSPGNYRLELEASGPEGEWTSRRSLFIRIPFRFYETGWFRWLTGVLILTFLTMSVILYIRQIRLKAAQKQDELALESIRGQMNPHFIYNSLNSINYFILRNDKYHANQYIADFSRLIRSILSNMTEEFILFERELQSVKDYLKLEHLRFGDKFDYAVECHVDGENDLWIMPGMVQSFIENAIWHGIRNLEEKKGFIKVEFSKPEAKGFLRCCIEDTGVGRKLSVQFRNDLPGKKSRGINIVAERLILVNKLRNADYRITMEDLYPDREETGTRVTVDIPLKV